MKLIKELSTESNERCEIYQALIAVRGSTFYLHIEGITKGKTVCELWYELSKRDLRDPVRICNTFLQQEFGTILKNIVE